MPKKNGSLSIQVNIEYKTQRTLIKSNVILTNYIESFCY